jgi:hypothetical protein
MELAIPTIHVNGTSRDSLLEDFCAAIDAIHDAGRKLARATPNGRDYYTQGPAAILSAMAQHEARMAKLKSIAAELEDIASKM